MNTRLDKGILMLAVGLLSLVVAGQAGTLNLLTPGLDGQATADADGYAPTVSADGRFVVFVSASHSLVTNQLTGSMLNVYVRELASGATRLVSVATNGFAGANQDANYPCVSADGRYVAFVSTADNLVTNDQNQVADVFVRDLVAGTTILASADATGNPPAFGDSTHPLLSADGQWVVFESRATNLAPNLVPVDVLVGGPLSWLYARNLASGQAECVNVIRGRFQLSDYDLMLLQNGGDQTHADLASLSADGHLVAFLSASLLLDQGPTVSLGDVLVRDLTQRRTVWASHALGPYFNAWAGAYRCLSAVLNDSGRFLVLKAVAPDNATVMVFRYDLQTDTTLLLATNANYVSPPDISADGRLVAFEAGADVWVWDAQTGVSQRASESVNGGPGHGNSHTPMLAADGARVAFLSEATDLTLAGGNGQCQMYVRDLAAGRTTLVSARMDGQPSAADLTTIIPSLSADGRYAVFDSQAAGLWAGADNGASEVFLADLGSASWFGAGDRPTLRLSRQSSVTLSWTPAGTRTWHAQYCESLSSGTWVDLPGTVSVNDGLATQADAAPGQRFYRLVIDP